MKYIDMHCDTISRLYDLKNAGLKGGGEEENIMNNRGHLDLVRMRAGDCLAQNFAMFTNLKRADDPHGYCMALYDFFKKELEENRDTVAQAVTADGIVANDRAGRMSAVLTVEEAAVCRGDVALLEELYGMGVRMMTLTWNYENELAYPNRVDMNTGISVPETERGLKKRGVEFVERMEELGMIVDVSHLGDAGFWDVAEVLKGPFAASHSNARAVASHPRNLTDEMIRVLAERGGVMGINFCARFLNDEAGDMEAGISRVSDMVRHIRHIRNVGGIECIGLGSDFDGIVGTLEVDSPAALHLLEEELYRQGFTAGEVEKIFYKNALRLYRDVWRG